MNMYRSWSRSVSHHSVLKNRLCRVLFVTGSVKETRGEFGCSNLNT